MAGPLGNIPPPLTPSAGPTPTIPRPAARTDVGSEFNAWAQVTRTLYVVLILTLLAAPAAGIGMILAWAVWKVTRPTWLTIAGMSILAMVSFVLFSSEVAWWWPWGALMPERLFHMLPVGSALPLGSPALWTSFRTELLLGPALLVALEGLLVISERTLTAGIYRQAREGRGQQSPVRDLLQKYASVVAPMAKVQVADAAHPAGGIRLGADNDNRRKPFDLSLDELKLHAFLPGASGSGKTTTLERIADGTMQAGWGIVVIDCKGGGLRQSTERLAARHHLPFVLVDPEDPKTIGYDPCTGSPSDVANKLIGSFTFGEAGEIYKQVAMASVPVLVRALAAAGQPVTLRTLADSLEPNTLRRLARDVEGDGSDAGRVALADEVTSLLADAEGAGKQGIGSLRYRFGALLQGSFGPLFSKDQKMLAWDAVLNTPTAVYVSLPVTAASEDVELMGRVLIQDLKQACGRRLRAVGNGATPQPVLVAIDEFAGLKEAKQIIDLLLQARQAAMALMLATQFLPQDPDLRKAVSQAGLLVVHRLEAKDSEEIAAQFGTRPTWKVTQQIDWESGTSEKGSVRAVEEYVVHPNTLRGLPIGTAAVLSHQTQRHAIVNVIRTV